MLSILTNVNYQTFFIIVVKILCISNVTQYYHSFVNTSVFWDTTFFTYYLCPIHLLYHICIISNHLFSNYYSIQNHSDVPLTNKKRIIQIFIIMTASAHQREANRIIPNYDCLCSPERGSPNNSELWLPLLTRERLTE